MKIYELNYFISQGLDREIVNKIALKIESLIQEKGGILVSSQKKKNIDLGYKIKNIKKAVLTNIKFQIKAENMKILMSDLKKIKEILRFMFVKEQKKVVKSISKISKKRSVKKDKLTISKEQGKVDLKKIEEKLGEILE